MKIKLILTTTNSKDSAQNISQALIENKLTPCIQILPNITSIYRWENKINKENEYLLIIKVLDKYLDRCISLISEIHNYDTPEIIEVGANILNQSYSNWFKENSK